MDCEVWSKCPLFGATDMNPSPLSGRLAPASSSQRSPRHSQGSKLFYDTFAAHLASMGWLPSVADKCVFLNSRVPEHAAVVLWVDDFIFIHENEETWKAFI